MEIKTERFNMALTPEDKAALRYLVERERMSAAAIVRRLIWDAYKARGGLFRLTPVVGDAASPPESGEQTRTSGQAGEGSAPHPPRA